jgi:hypothetical protein
MPDKTPKKPLNINIDTPNVDINYDRNEQGEKKLNVKVEKMPFVQRLKAIGKLLIGK